MKSKLQLSYSDGDLNAKVKLTTGKQKPSMTFIGFTSSFRDVTGSVNERLDNAQYLHEAPQLSSPTGTTNSFWFSGTPRDVVMSPVPSWAG